MYSKKGLFCEINDYKMIEKEFNYYSLGYYYKKNLKGKFIVGGKRNKIFNNNCTASKISLIFFEPGMIMSNSHCIYPYYNNFQNATTILRHYKFIKSDLIRINERIRLKNFVNDSEEYQNYLKKYKENNIINFYEKEKSYKWISSKNINEILNSIK